MMRLVQTAREAGEAGGERNKKKVNDGAYFEKEALPPKVDVPGAVHNTGDP